MNIANEAKLISRIIHSCATDDGEPLSSFQRTYTLPLTKDDLSLLLDTLLSSHPDVIFILTQKDDSNLSIHFGLSNENPLFIASGFTQDNIFSSFSFILRETDKTGTPNIYQTKNGFIFERKISAESDFKLADSLSAVISAFLKRMELVPEEKDEADEFLDFDNF